MIKRIFIASLALASLWGCDQKVEQTNLASIEGCISPIIEGYVGLSLGSLIDSAKISKEGQFSFQLDIDMEETGMLILNNNFTNIYVEPGKSLILDINLANFPGEIEYSGDLGPVNKYLRLARKLDQNTAISKEQLYMLEADKFIHLTDSIKDMKIQLLKEYVMRYPVIDSAFITRHKTDIQYAWAMQRLNYPGYYALMKRKQAVLPDQYHANYLKEVDINNPQLLVSSVYQGFLQDYLDFKQTNYLQDHPEVRKLWFPESVARFRVIPQEFSNSLVKDFVLYKSMNDHLDNFGTEHLETFLTNFQFNCMNDDYKSLINTKLGKLKTLERGQPAPAFTAIGTDDQMVSLLDYKGSLLYVNLWATWSSWSLQEFPYWEDLIKKFAYKDVKFISISLDFAKDIKNWKYIIKEKELKGIHLIQDPNTAVWQNEYFINDLPRYLLIDPEGKIISVHAPRPGENMESVLNQLLKN